MAGGGAAGTVCTAGAPPGGGFTTITVVPGTFACTMIGREVGETTGEGAAGAGSG
jgi:hypothetical protein